MFMQTCLDYVWFVLPIHSIQVRFAGITMQSNLRRRPNCFNLLHQMKLANRLGKTNELEDCLWGVWKSLLKKFHMQVFHSGVDQGKWPSRSLQHRRPWEWSCSELVAVCGCNDSFQTDHNGSDARFWQVFLASAISSSTLHLLVHNSIVCQLVQEIHYAQVLDPRAHQGWLVQFRFHFRIWSLFSLGTGVEQLSRGPQASLSQNGTWLPASPWEQTQSSQCSFYRSSVAKSVSD